MIVQNQEKGAMVSLIDLLGGNAKTSKGGQNDLFSKLLLSLSAQEGQSLSATDKKGNFHAVVSSKEGLKGLRSLLEGNDETDAQNLFSKELINSLTHDQVRSLINRSKEYLKKELSAKTAETGDAASFPKSLSGLIKMADKMGLDLQSLTLSTIIPDPEEQKALPAQLLSQPLLEAKGLKQLAALTEETTTMQTLTQLLEGIKTKENKVQKSGTETPEIQTKATTDTLKEEPLKALLQHFDQKATAAADTENVKAAPKPNAASSHENKTDVLAALLQGTSESRESTTTGSDSSSSVRIEGDPLKSLATPSADSLEVKAKEAQQGMRHFASDLKEAVENYKPPFTKLTMKLNPEKLGEVEVTLVQRGNNVHVNIQSSNTNTVAFLAHNATELKAQLAHQGITNATMNFMSGGDGQPQQQNHSQQQQNYYKAYQSFEELDLNEEQLSALEIIIPHYA